VKSKKNYIFFAELKFSLEMLQMCASIKKTFMSGNCSISTFIPFEENFFRNEYEKVNIAKKFIGKYLCFLFEDSQCHTASVLRDVSVAIKS
jgi:hypothetical protein